MKKKSSSRDRFQITRGWAKDRRREREQAIQDFTEAAAAVDPEYATHRTLEMVLTQRRCWRRFLQRRFGARIVNTDGGDHIIDIRKPPESLREWWIFRIATWSHGKYELSFRNMLRGGARVLEKPEAKFWTETEKKARVSQGALKGFVSAQLHADELISLTASPDAEPPAVREALAAVLTGFADAQISLARNKRLSAVLEEQGRNAKAELTRELPAVVMEEWGAGDTVLDLPAGKYSKFVQRVARNLERGGNEGNSLARRGKLSPLGDLTEVADGLSEFERQEEARQKLDALENKAKLSRQQAEIWRRLRRGMEIAEIASELSIPRKQVSTQKRRIKRKMQKIRASAGL